MLVGAANLMRFETNLNGFSYDWARTNSITMVFLMNMRGGQRVVRFRARLDLYRANRSTDADGSPPDGKNMQKTEADNVFFSV